MYQPQTEDQVRSSTRHVQRFSNEDRPHQGLSFRNQPPRVAFPSLPPLPAVPADVDPDQWLTHYDGRCYTRRVQAPGTVVVTNHHYYVRQALWGRYVLLPLDARTREFVVYHEQQPVKRLPIKGLVGQRVSFTRWVEQLSQEARRDERRRWSQRRRAHAGTSPADTRC